MLHLRRSRAAVLRRDDLLALLPAQEGVGKAADVLKHCEPPAV